MNQNSSVFYDNKKRIVLTFGSFDIVHLGHQYYLSQARKYGDYLVTILARDSTIIRVKGRSPRNHEQSRLECLQLLGWSDEVVLGQEKNFEWCLHEYKPAVICLGYDQRDVSGKLLDITKELGIEIYRAQAYKPQRRKSSILAKKLLLKKDGV